MAVQCTVYSMYMHDTLIIEGSHMGYEGQCSNAREDAGKGGAPIRTLNYKL